MRDEQALRYIRHLRLPEMDEAAHERLQASRVLVVGVGGLGSPALYYLAAAGVGHLGIVDADVVELSNLQRQILHSTADLGRPKTISAAEKLRALNPDVDVVGYQERFTEHNAVALLAGYDVIVDGVDNFASRYLLNDACVLQGKTLIEGAVLRYTGMVTTIKGGETACYRCLFPAAPADGQVPSAAEAGVFGPVAGMIGVLQAAEALKVLAGFGQPLINRALYVDLLTMAFDVIEVAREPDCPVCGQHPTITTLDGERVR
ncbi:MAG: HesA/MoeB/ThiF family protein [Thermoleophilia bacterium]